MVYSNFVQVNNGALALACLSGHLDAVKFLVDVVNLSVNDKHQVCRSPVVIIYSSFLVSTIG